MTRIAAAIDALQGSAVQLEAEVRLIPPEWLPRKPAPEVWSVFDNLCHIQEFVPYWVAQIEFIKADPSKEWGRTHADPARLAAVADTSDADLDTVLAGIRSRIDAACESLSHLREQDLVTEAPSRNPRWGTKPAGFILETLLINHLESHRRQIQRNVTGFRQSSSGEAEKASPN